MKTFKQFKEESIANTKNKNVQSQALGLSSGTLAGLVGSKQSKDVDKAQSDFVLFVYNSKKPFKNWQDAWKDFSKSGKFKIKGSGQIRMA